MFTGIVEELGEVVSLDGGRLRLRASSVLADVEPGASIAVNGCCLTVLRWDDDPEDSWWEADVSPETFRRTTLGGLAMGDPVNLERPVRLADRLGGHLVQGHVDGVGEVVAPPPELRVRIPAALSRYVVDKGSVTVDGVSLTVVDPVAHEFSVALIPHTCAVTTLGSLQVGDVVNLELDVLAKYVESLLVGYLDGPDRRTAADAAPGARP